MAHFCEIGSIILLIIQNYINSNSIRLWTACLAVDGLQLGSGVFKKNISKPHKSYLGPLKLEIFFEIRRNDVKQCALKLVWSYGPLRSSRAPKQCKHLPAGPFFMRHVQELLSRLG